MTPSRRSLPSPVSVFVLLVLSAAALRTAEQEKPPIFEHPLEEAAADSAYTKLTAELARTKVLRASFHQRKKISVLRKPLISTGQFLLARDRGVCWLTKEPFSSTFVITRGAIKQKSADGKIVTVITSKEQPIIDGFTRVFLALFTGDNAEMEKQFELYFEDNQGHWTLGLIPRDRAVKRQIEYMVLSGRRGVETLFILEKNGDTTQTTFGDHRLEPPELTEEEQAYFDT